MQVVSVNVARARPVKLDDPSSVQTGIYKEPVEGPVAVSRLGLAGDAICSTKVHGGPDQAVYVYGSIDYDWWAKELGRPIEPGLFGENLTIDGFACGGARAGDRLKLGQVVLEVTGPRLPCGTFATRMGDPKFAKRFREAERPGAYCRVLREGTIAAGDAVVYDAFVGATVGVVEMSRDYFDPILTEAEIRRFLDAPIGIRVRAHKEKQLAKLLRHA